ncbi:MAG: late competence development ComFB family protein, partial [Myxococcota bacterium]
MAVTNVTWEVVHREYGSLRGRMPSFCGCDTCKGDVLVYALNRLSPHYVSTRQGEILTGLTLGSDQE